MFCRKDKERKKSSLICRTKLHFTCCGFSRVFDSWDLLQKCDHESLSFCFHLVCLVLRSLVSSELFVFILFLALIFRSSSLLSVSGRQFIEFLRRTCGFCLSLVFQLGGKDMLRHSGWCSTSFPALMPL